MAWTREQVAARLAEAADTLRRLPDPDRIYRMGARSAWPDVVRAAAEAYGAAPVRTRLGPPGPGAIDRLDHAMVWLGWLSEPQRRIAWALACGASVSGLARRIGCHRNTVANRHAQALDALVARLDERA